VKFTVAIAKRGRNDYLRTCLHYLDLANTNTRHAVTVCVTDDGVEPSAQFSMQNCKLIYDILPNSDELFNKSKLLNHSIERGSGFDVLSVVDLDMAYAPYFFGQVVERMHGALRCSGARLSEAISQSVMLNHPKFEEIQRMQKDADLVGPSQVSLSRDIFEAFIHRFGRLYHEGFKGWGCEDNLTLRRLKLFVPVRVVTGMWFHLWHPSVHAPYYQENLAMMNELLNERHQRVRR